jgi:hypothetical protein
MSERYVVELEFKRIGDLGADALTAKMRKAETGVQSFKRSWSDLGNTVAPIGGMIDGAVGATMRLARTGAMIGAGAFLAGSVYGVTNLNNELEKAEISLGTIFSTQGMAANVPAGIERSKTLISQMRVDAQKLPGEFEDLMRIFTTGAIPAFHSGASIDQWRDLSSKAMAAGKVANMDLHQVAREMTLLLEGRAGTQNTFGTKLGIKAAGFNTKSSEERLKILSTELGKFSGAIAQFEGSYDAQSSTLIDNFKNFARVGTSSLFIHVKDAMKEANGWFSSHQAEATAFAAKWGSRLVNGFESGKRALTEWGPLLFNFAEGAYDRITSIWVDVQPYAEKFGTIVKEALKDPNGTIDKLITLAKLWAGMKIGGAMVGGFASGGAKGAMMGGGSALAMYGVGNAALNGGSSESYVETTAGGAIAGFGMGGPLGAAAGALTGAVVALTQTYQQSATAETDFRARMASEAETWNTDMRRFYASHGFTAAEAEQKMREHGLAVQNTIMEVDKSAGLVAGSIYNLAANIESASYALLNSADKRDNEIGSFWGNMLQLGAHHAAAKSAQASADVANPHKHKSKGGGSGVMKVEIVVTSNQHPSRIAREVVGELGKLQRISGQSPHTTNYSALDEVD